MITDMPGYDPNVPVLRKDREFVRKKEPTLLEELDVLVSMMEIGKAYWPETLAR